ncbi:MAG: hypothetical protein MRZ39_07155 [Oscillospiraceae bacterium]|nr:hypothetical protein [Oscillospiraceae bacterium]
MLKFNPKPPDKNILLGIKQHIIKYTAVFSYDLFGRNVVLIANAENSPEPKLLCKTQTLL